MGLDMFLHATRFLWREDDPIKKAIIAAIPELSANNMEPKRVQVEAMYWRKANQIHSWFVQNCQNGLDECQDTNVSRKKLQELLDTCQEVLNDHSKAKELLEPKGGFFFGSTDIDEYYWQDLQNTVDGLKRALALPNDWDFQYRSSW